VVEPVPTHGRPRSRTWWWVLALVALAAIVAFIVVLVQRGGDDSTSPNGRPTATGTPSPGATQPQAHRVTQFSGAGDTTTKTFKVALNWEIRWTAPRGSGFTVELLRPDGTSRGNVVTAGAKTSGSVFVGEAGDFKLKVTSSKPWTVEIRSRSIGS
jgi:hypothetical protein